MKNLTLCTIAAIGAAAIALAGEPQTLTYPDLVDRMIDLEHLAVLPPPGETCRQWSSYDRASRYDEATGTYVNWAANNDGPMFIREEDGGQVMAEMEGPGCIWRIWSALPQKGHVKIYLDGREQPTLDMPFEDYFTGKSPPLDYPMLSYALESHGSRGMNLYLPIPYQKSCKVVAEKGWGRYYHFNYSTFPKGTTVPTFPSKLSETDAAALGKVNDFFAARLGADPAGERPGQKTERGKARLAPGESQSIEITGPRAITAIRGLAEFKDRDDEMAALRHVTLKITFDGADEPQVWCPLGDFFGTAPGVNLYKSLLTGMTDDGAYSLWYMPLAKGAKIELANEDEIAREVSYEITHAPLARPFDELGHFHCKWHRDVFPVSKDRWPDWTMVKAEGRGRFCGVMLHVWNPRGGWWGEGDEKFFVDGEKFPSTIGTGSEDYFGYAWGNPGLFQMPYHCQTMTQNNKGHQSLLRWHVSDAVPFQKSFEGCIEKYFGNDRGTIFACTACWYLAPGGVDPIGPTPVAERHGYTVASPMEAGGFKVLGEPKGDVQTQAMAHYSAGKWHNDDHLWWTGAKPGDKLDVALPVETAGKQEVSVVLTKARDYAVVQLYLDGRKVGPPIDLYNPSVINTEPIPLGAHDLTQGQHVLTVEIVGANDAAVKSYMFGLDRVLLKPAGKPEI